MDSNEKQKYINENIIEKGYNPEDLSNFVTRHLGVSIDTLDLEKLKEMVNSFKKDPTRPITTTYHTYWGAMLMYGGASLYKPEFLKDWENILTDDIVHTFEDDWFYSYVLLINGIRPRLADPQVMFSPYTYVPYIVANQMYDLNMYNTGKTANTLNKRLEELGYTFAGLVKEIYKKYRNTA